MIDFEELCDMWDWRTKQIKEHCAAGRYSEATDETNNIKNEIQNLKIQVVG